jgi:hypothetical protein
MAPTSDKPTSLFYAALHRLEAECYLIERGECDGRLHAHHIYPKRLLKALAGGSANVEAFVAAHAIADARNGVLLCDRHHHRVENGLERFDRGDMPTRLAGFEVAYDGITAWWPRIYQRGLDVAQAEPEGVIP